VLNKQRAIGVVCVIGCLSAGASADLIRTTYSGVIEQATDTRTAQDDFLEGTALAVGSYTAAVGDAWSYSITFDSDVISGASNGNDAIYGGDIAGSLTVAGRTISLNDNGQWYFYFSNNIPFMEIFHDVGSGGFIGVAFLDFIGTGLINGGDGPTSADPYGNLVTRAFNFSSPTANEFNVLSAQFDVVVEVIPGPGPLAALGGAGLVLARRRRSR